MNQITETETLITEAMHGAVVADSYGIPWIPVRTTDEILSLKWEDWCQSIGLTYRPERMTPIWDKPDLESRILAMKQRLKSQMVTRDLKRIVRRARPVLSSSSKRKENLERLIEKLELLRVDSPPNSGQTELT